jgi:hypothetical protein
MTSIRIIEALPEENLIFPDEFVEKLPDSPFPDFCCLDCQHQVTALRQELGDDDPCMNCSQGGKQPNQEPRNTGA